MSNELNLLIDGLVYQLQVFGGISRLFSEILPRMCELDDSLNVTLLTCGKLRQSPPQHSRITHCHIPNIERWMRPARLWRAAVPPIQQFIRKLWVGTGTGKIWHSTYFTIPEKWSGASVVTVHDMIFERFPHLYKGRKFDSFRAQRERCVRRADAVICVSNTTKQEIFRFYALNTDSVHVTPHGCGQAFRLIDDSEEDVWLPTEQPFLLYVGSRTAYKNFDILIQAYHAWSHKNDIALVIVGSPLTAEEKQYFESLNLYGRIYPVTGADDEILCRLYNRAVAFVYPSLYEGFGIPLLEAMACGCPVIASQIPSTIEVADDCPIYFQADKTDDLIGALDTALHQGRNYQGVATGLERVKSYTWEKTAARTLDVYRKLSLGNVSGATLAESVR